MHLGKFNILLLALLVTAMVLAPLVNAEENERICVSNIVGKTVPAPQTMDIGQLKERHIQKTENRFLIPDFITYLTFWNENLDWGLTQEEIAAGAEQMDREYLNNYQYESTGNYDVKNLEKFGRDLQRVIELTDRQTVDFIAAQEKQIHSDYQSSRDSSKTFQQSLMKTGASIMASPSTQSAPSATGTLYTAIVFTDFQTPGEEGVWRESHKDDAYYDAWVGTNQIESQADSRAGVDNTLGYYTVTVSGQNTGDNSNTWGTSGWMERAAQNLGYSDSNSDGRYTDDMARALKTYAGADSVSIMFLTHDAFTAYAIGPDQGFADRASIAYWWVGSGGVHYFSQPFDYEHEALHLYGALDEYIPQSYCGQTSILAVDPMQQFYTNTNHVTCAGATNSVMRDRGLTVISASTKKFIGWGDHDNDGTLDPFDSTP